MSKLAYRLGEAGMVMFTPVAFTLLFGWICLLAYFGWSVMSGVLGSVGRILGN